MDPFPLHFCIALGPLAVYLVVLGVINFSRRPFLTTGGRDLAALGLAVSGFVIVGPMELFFPQDAAIKFGGGGYVWVLLLAFYALCLTLLVLMVRPRLVIYNVTADQLRKVLADVVSEIDRDARWAGESLVLPGLGVQLHVEPFGAMRNVQLVAAGPQQNLSGWRRLELALHPPLRQLQVSPNPYGFGLILVGLTVMGAVSVWMVSHSQKVAQALWEMLRI